MKLSAAFAVALALHAAGAETRLKLIGDAIEAERAFSAPANTKELECGFSPTRAAIGIDLRFHAGFGVSIPLENLQGDGGAIRVLVRVTPVSSPGRPTFFSMLTSVPALGGEAKGEVELQGEYAVGPGRYSVDALATFGDAACRKQWHIEAERRRPFDRIPLAMAADTAGELPREPFDDTGKAVPRAPRSMLVKLLVNFSPAGVDDTILDAEDVRVIAAILRAVSREERFGRFSVVAFSSDQARVLHRQPAASKIDFRSIGRAVRRLPSGVVSIRQMQDPRSTTRFLERLLAEELGPGEEAPDAVVVISPKLSLEERLSERELAERGRVSCPVFLLSYNPQPIADPWRGVLARAVKKAYKGIEYTITSPRDLGTALLRIRSELP
jgi:hypothetical protein